VRCFLLTSSLFLNFPPPDSGQYHNLLPWTIGHQVYLNVRCNHHHFYNEALTILSRVYGYVTNNSEFWVGWLDLLTPSCILLTYSQSITTAHSQWLPKTRSILTGLRLSSLLVFLLLSLTWFLFTNDERRISHSALHGRLYNLAVSK
jgi:hypothetical protein